MKIQYLVNVAKLEFGIGKLFVPLQYFNTLTKNIGLNFFLIFAIYWETPLQM